MKYALKQETEELPLLYQPLLGYMCSTDYIHGIYNVLQNLKPCSGTTKLGGPLEAAFNHPYLW